MQLNIIAYNRRYLKKMKANDYKKKGGRIDAAPLLFIVICFHLLQIPSVICDNIKLHVLQGTHVCV